MHAHTHIQGVHTKPVSDKSNQEQNTSIGIRVCVRVKVNLSWKYSNSSVLRKDSQKYPNVFRGIVFNGGTYPRLMSVHVCFLASSAPYPAVSLQVESHCGIKKKYIYRHI